jgi:hypothetical protein
VDRIGVLVGVEDVLVSGMSDRIGGSDAVTITTTFKQCRAAPARRPLKLRILRLEGPASILCLPELNLQLGDEAPRLGQPLLVRPIPVLEFVYPPELPGVRDAQVDHGCELPVPLVLGPGDGPLAAFAVVDLVSAADHGELGVEPAGGESVLRGGEDHASNTRPHRRLAVVREHEGGWGARLRVGDKVVKMLLEISLPGAELPSRFSLEE